jgi:3'-phosphoadenosine 5'-phosphosulfate sulfotransferase (PAPS reductase)/FAD synthetase
MFQQLTIPIFQKPECLETEIEWFDKISESSQTEDVPSIIRKIIEDRECVIVLSISGGKDSQAAQAFILHLKELTPKSTRKGTAKLL